MRTRKYFRFVLALSVLFLGTALGEQYLAKGDARVLGNKEDEQTFKTCRGNEVKFRDVPGYQLIKTAEHCKGGGGTIKDRGDDGDERRIIERMKRGSGDETGWNPDRTE
jgi:hypothetical protein